MKVNKYRTNTCGELTLKDLGKEVTLSGFVSTIRDHGGVMFVDLRDWDGVTQVVVHDENMLKGVSKETVIRISGKVVKRDEDTINNNTVTLRNRDTMEQIKLDVSEIVDYVSSRIKF